MLLSNVKNEREKKMTLFFPCYYFRIVGCFFISLHLVIQEEKQENLLKKLHQLKDKLNQVSTLTDLDLLVVLGNFLRM